MLLVVSKRTAQLSAHPQSCVRAQVIVAGATWECNSGKNGGPLPAERFSGLYIQWFAYKYGICEVGLWKNCVFIPKFPVYHREVKGSEIFLMLILSEK